jgi:hypothetical protein
MDIVWVIPVFVVVGFAVVQSVFGVGILVFGTPTLLIAGYSFEQTLATLLPASIAISLLQVIDGGGFRLDSMRRQFLWFTGPLVLLGATLILTVGSGTDIRILVGAMLVVSGAIRVNGRWRDAAGSFIRRHLPSSLTALGLIHGLSNLGGGVLTLIAGSLYDDKRDVRRQIAFCYGMMASVQLATLAAMGRAQLGPTELLLLPVLAGASYVAIGNRAFRATSQRAYQVSLTALIILLGIGLMIGI